MKSLTNSSSSSSAAARASATGAPARVGQVRTSASSSASAGKVGVVRTGLVKVKSPAPTASTSGVAGGMALTSVTSSSGARLDMATSSPNHPSQPVGNLSLNTPPMSPNGGGSTGTSSCNSSPGKRSPSKPPILIRTTFVIRGKVQGVYFRKFTQQKAVELGIFGVVRNEPDGSVTGEAEGRIDALNDFKHWLQTKGSPKSKIDSADFVDVQGVDSRKYSRFDIDRSVEK